MASGASPRRVRGRLRDRVGVRARARARVRVRVRIRVRVRVRANPTLTLSPNLDQVHRRVPGDVHQRAQPDRLQRRASAHPCPSTHPSASP